MRDVPCVPRAVWLFAAAFVLVTSLPYLVGVLNAPPGGVFTGSVLEQTRLDYNSHLTKMQLGAQGEWGDRTLFTAEDHAGVFARTFYVTLGHVARWSGLSVTLTYQLARVVATLAMVVTIWLFVAHFFAGDRPRWAAFLLATLAGGLGWLLYLFAPAMASALTPVEFWVPETSVLVGVLVFPHFAAAIALMLAFFLVIERWLRAPTWRDVAWASALILPISWLQPFTPLLTGLVVLVVVTWAVWRRRLRLAPAAMMAPVAAAHLVGPVYHYIALNDDPIWHDVIAQNIAQSPPPIYYLFAYLPLLLPALWGLWSAWRAGESRLTLPAAWALVTAVLIYGPVQTQRRFLLGVQIPLAMLAAVGLEDLYGRWRQRGRTRERWRLLFTAGLLFSMISHALVLLTAVGALNRTARPELFLTADERAALDWLRAQPADTVVLSAFDTGSNVAAHSGRRVYVGHWIETPDYETKRALVERFFDPAGMDDAERLALLTDTGVDYVWHDWAARELGDWQPSKATFLDPVFVSDTLTVYEVLP